MMNINVRFKYTAFIIVMIFLGGRSFAQDTRTATPKPPKPVYQAKKAEKKGFFSFLKKEKTNQLSITTREEFRANIRKRQLEAVKQEYKLAKVQRREAKKGKSFFGHKRPPKKRPPGKQKFCRICRLKH